MKKIMKNLAETLVPSRIVEPKSWVGHIPFAYWLVEKTRPQRIVELGVHTGNSFFAFCDAVKALDLNCECIGIDTFKGDMHAGFYGEEVWTDVNDHIMKNYNANVHLYRQLFDDALLQIPDGSIDILHIDGCHTYEETKHNYLVWLPKMKKTGVILFHDIYIQNSTFGVDKVWHEIYQENDHYLTHTLSFRHSCGLGVFFLNGKPDIGDFRNESIVEYFERLGGKIESRTKKGWYQEQEDKFVEDHKAYPLTEEECFLPKDIPSVCLAFICRDNEKTIERMLESCLPYIDSVCACDTGSKDYTTEQISLFCKTRNIPFVIHEDVWVNFGHNRTLMMQHAKGMADYIFVMDTDEVLELKDQVDRKEWEGDIIMIPTSDGVTTYYRDRIFKDKFDWKWIGAAHEFAQGEGAQTKQYENGFNLKLFPKQNNDHIRRNYDLLMGDYKVNPKDTRTLFYLGNSAFDLGLNDEALKFYQERADMSFFPEEQWYATHRIGQIYERMDKAQPAEIHYLMAYAARPTRMEPLFALAMMLARKGNHAKACVYFAMAMLIPYPKEDVLFVEDYLYNYNCAFYYCISLYYSGNFEKCFLLSEILANGSKDKMPADVYDRHLRNIVFCEQQLVKQGWKERFIVCPADMRFDGLGDNMLHSHLARLAKRRGFKKVFLSSLMKFKTPGTREAVYLNNPAVDGEIERYGLRNEDQWARNILAGDVPTYDIDYMTLIALSHGLWNENVNEGPELFKTNPKKDYTNISGHVFDGNGKTNITDYRKVLKYFDKIGMPSYQLVFEDIQGEVKHSNTTLHRIDLPGVDKIVICSMDEYYDVIDKARSVICLTSATAILCGGLKVPTTVLTDTAWLNNPMAKCHMQKNNNYVNLDLI